MIQTVIRTVKRLPIFLLLVLVVGFSGLQAQDATSEPDPQSGPGTALVEPRFSGANAFAHIEDYLSVGPRPTGSPGIIAAGNQILDELSALGWATSEDYHLLDFGPLDALSPAAQQTLADWQPFNVGPAIDDYLARQVNPGWTGSGASFDHLIVPLRNLVASTGAGTGPTIIIGAHYDSRIYADQDPDATLHREPMPGANDGGSGVGVLLELARVISEHYTPNVEIRFVFFDAEDNGRIEPFTNLYGGFANGYLIGSTLYAGSLDLTTESIQSMLLVDMVGDLDQVFPQEGYSVQYAPDIANAIWSVAADLGYGEHFPTQARGPITDDHVPFLQRGIPAVDIIDLDYPHWHTTSDTIDQVSADSLERVGRTIEAYLAQTGAITPTNG